MKKLLLILICIVGIISCSNAYAVSLSDGIGNVFCTKDADITAIAADDSSVHVHIATTPSLIYAIVVTPTAAGGYAQMFDTKGAAVEDVDYVKGSKTKCLADVQGATANASVTIEWSKGLAANRLFIDTYNARAEVYYNE